jgi:signal transduction histidine kinase
VIDGTLHISNVGIQQATQDFHDPDGRFVDRDLYLFVFERGGIYTVFGSDPQRVGMNMKDSPGLDGADILRQCLEAADAGGGWVEYDHVQFKTGETHSKASFISPLSDGTLIGCGTYLNRRKASEEGVGSAGARFESS